MLVKRPAKHPARSAGRLSLFALDSSPFLPRSLTFSRLHFYSVLVFIEARSYFLLLLLLSPSLFSSSFFCLDPNFWRRALPANRFRTRIGTKIFRGGIDPAYERRAIFFFFFKLPLFTIFELRIYIIKNNRILIGPTVELRFNILNIGSIKIYRSKLFPIRCNEISLEILWDNNIFNEYFSLFNT